VSERSSDRPYEPSRALPDRPNLRYLKVEAKRRLAAGEFGTLHDAQLAIAREHGFSSWATLKASIEAAAGYSGADSGVAPGPALAHVRWILDRFREADDPAWSPPDGDELAEHFSELYLTVVPLSTVISTLGEVAPRLRGELTVTIERPEVVRARVGDLHIDAAAAPEPPGRLTALRLYRGAGPARDPRTAEPPVIIEGNVPDGAVEIAAEGYAELGLAALVLAGSGPAASGPDGAGRDGGWLVAVGWADLDRGAAVTAAHRFPVYGSTKAVTAVAVLRLVAAGRLALDDPANRHLRTVRLADGAVTVRQLLAHTGGVSSPEARLAAEVPDQVALLGSPVPSGRPRGAFAPSDGGYAVLGQLIADLTGEPYPRAVTRLVLAPLGMHSSAFPARWPGDRAVTGYQLTETGRLDRAPAEVTTMPAAGGLWATPADLVRFGAGWATLLPAELAAEALRPLVAQPASGAYVGLGWLMNAPGHLYGHPGTGPGGSSSLIVAPDTGTVLVACTNRQVPVEPVCARLLRLDG
jgi:CubicO group peptidase (beta-lactamase class C family)